MLRSPHVHNDQLERPFPIEVVVNNVKVTVTLLLKPGVTVEVSTPEQPEDAARDSDLRTGRPGPPPTTSPVS